MSENSRCVSTVAGTGDTSEEFERRNTLVQDEKFSVLQEGTDNATHFKSKENLNFWSERPQNHEWMKIVWVEFDCPGHGKGPWDGLGVWLRTCEPHSVQMSGSWNT
jgi:hypothetical protein